MILTPVCVFLGVSIVIASQISVDLTTTKTRFSGGRGALPENPEMANAVLTIGLVSLLATSLIGFFCLENRLRNHPHRCCESVIDPYLHWMD